MAYLSAVANVVTAIQYNSFKNVISAILVVNQQPVTMVWTSKKHLPRLQLFWISAEI